LLTRNPIGRTIDLVEGVMEAESADLLRSFFRDIRSGKDGPTPVAEWGA
jgi:hypothetical protein